MLARFILFVIGFVVISSCSNDANQTEAPTENVAIVDTLPKCSFQIQSIQSLLGSHYKLIGGLRTCDDSGQVTKELVLFAEGEPINNHKECNLFATTDTASTWSVEQSPLKIEVLFNNNLPADSTILMKVNTIYDSIEVIYSVSGSAAI